MALSQHIVDLIKAYKAMPNGERKNKVISHLKDAEAHAKLLEQEDERFHSPAEESSLAASAPAVRTITGNEGGLTSDSSCICRPGMRDKTCPAAVHVA